MNPFRMLWVVLYGVAAIILAVLAIRDFPKARQEIRKVPESAAALILIPSVGSAALAIICTTLSLSAFYGNVPL